MKENLLLLGFVVVTIILGYLWYAQWRPVDVTGDATMENIYGGEFLATTIKLKSINLDTDFFQNPGFLSLTDQTPVIEMPTVIGKKNPFLPLALPQK